VCRVYSGKNKYDVVSLCDVWSSSGLFTHDGCAILCKSLKYVIRCAVCCFVACGVMPVARSGCNLRSNGMWNGVFRLNEDRCSVTYKNYSMERVGCTVKVRVRHTEITKKREYLHGSGKADYLPRYWRFFRVVFLFLHRSKCSVCCRPM
jgi:hypothetical protein